MKKSIILIELLIIIIPVFAQQSNESYFLSKLALICYERNEKGFFQKKENVVLDKMPPYVSMYGYNKKTHQLYIETELANCVVTVNDEYHKVLKKRNDIPQLKPEELDAKVKIVNNQIMNRVERLNKARQQFINDSIEQRKIEELKKAKEDSLRLISEQNEALYYLNTKKWFAIPVNKTVLYCELCEKKFATKDILNCYKIKNDTIYWGESKSGRLGLEYKHIHVAVIPEILKNDKQFQYHYRIFADSLENKLPSLDFFGAIESNLKSLNKYSEQLKKEAPNGLILDWGWDAEYSNISFNFNYLNTNKNTIKYIEVFWAVKNDVGDVRKTGSFRGTGPLEEWESASWKWDHSSYYVSGDATIMNLTKIVITYMNGSIVTIPKNKIKIDY